MNTFKRLHEWSSGEGSHSVTWPISTTCPGGLARDCLGMYESGTFHGDWQDARDERTTSSGLDTEWNEGRGKRRGKDVADLLPDLLLLLLILTEERIQEGFGVSGVT